MNTLKALKKYIVSIAQMENKAHSFEMDGGLEFFQHYKIDSVNGGNFEAKILLEKTETMINLVFDIKGNLVLECDRSLEEFEYPFSTIEKLILKFGEHDEDLADGIKIINKNTQSLDLSHEIYELISLTIPMKKLHPKYTEEADDINNEGFIVYSTENTNKENTENTAIDPRWAALKNLK